MNNNIKLKKYVGALQRKELAFKRAGVHLGIVGARLLDAIEDNNKYLISHFTKLKNEAIADYKNKYTELEEFKTFVESRNTITA